MELNSGRRPLVRYRVIHRTDTFDSKAHKLVSAGDDNKIRLWDLQTGEGKIIGNSESLVTRGRFSRDGTRYAACDFSGFVHIWETQNWNLIKKLRVTHNKLRSLAWGMENDFVICVGHGNEIIELKLNDDSVKAYPVTANCSDIVFSSESEEFLVSIQDVNQKLLFYEFPGGKLEASLNFARLPTRMAVDPTSNRVAVGFDVGGFGVVSVKDRKIEREVGTDQSDGDVIDVVFSTDGRNVLTSVRGKRALIYETVTWEKIGSIDSHRSDIHAITFSADGLKLATGDMSGKIRVLELPN